MAYLLFDVIDIELAQLKLQLSNGSGFAQHTALSKIGFAHARDIP